MATQQATDEADIRQRIESLAEAIRAKACEFVEHWFCVGLPIALSVRHYSRSVAKVN
jgi:hypothetical protein